MKKLFNLLIFLLLLGGGISAFANNLQVGTPVFTDKNTVTGQVSIQFNISWDNSWRTTNLNGDGVANWDAVWLFVKYKKVSDGLWYHATLSTNNASHSSGTGGTPATLHARSDGKGAFIYRRDNGEGTFSSNSVKLCWQYVSDGMGNNLTTDIAQVRVFGIEVVYIPQGSFYVGSGGSETNHFYTYGGNTPYQITSEGAITVGTTNGNLYYADQYSEQDEGSIPATFPKGYNAFYCMKYETTQEQYCDFLNTLTRSQQDTRTYTSLASGVTSVTNRYVMSNQSSISNSYRNGIRCDATIPATTPITFYCDFNGNGVPNENSDGQNIACNYLSWADGIAYSDWSGLRPMTELEYEKVCRGSATAVANEYAWGSTSITSAGTSSSNITNSGQATEGSNVSGANCNYSGGIGGSLRVGCFSGGSRQSSGASYYGVMEMSGNLYERCVTVGNSTGRAFTGTVGDGLLDASGNANIATCPGITATGSGFRGGSWFYNNSSCRTSDRSLAATTSNARYYYFYGFRCISGIY